MYQKWIGVGRITKDLELRYGKTNNTPMCNFTLAVNRPYGEKQADFINCLCFKKQAENLTKYCSKGSMIAVDGRIQTRDYMDEKNNVRRYVTEVMCDSVTFLDTKKTDHGSQEETPSQDELPKGNFNNVEDDLPF